MAGAFASRSVYFGRRMSGVVIPIIGPSKAGKTESTRALLSTGRRMSVILRRFDLDKDLGPANRGNGEKAVAFVEALRSNNRGSGDSLLDVGSGQLVSERFAAYLRTLEGYPRSVVAVWCDESTFRQRHGDNAPNEVWRYYGAAPLVTFWEAAASVGRLVDTSGPYAPDRWAESLERVVNEILRAQD